MIFWKKQASFPHRWSQIFVWSVNIYPACEWVLQHAEDSQLRSLDSVCWALPPGFTCVYVCMCLCTQLSIPVERFRELTLHSCPCCTVNLIFSKTHLKHTQTFIHEKLNIVSATAQSATARSIKACQHRQEVQLLLKPNSRTGNKCDLSVFDCWCQTAVWVSQQLLISWENIVPEIDIKWYNTKKYKSLYSEEHLLNAQQIKIHDSMIPRTLSADLCWMCNCVWQYGLFAKLRL